nr:hypothetical protein Iba_chr06aCG1610 [Ipomoea batatas]
MKQSTDKPGTLKATSSIVHASSILVLVWLMAISPKRNSVTTECPEWAIMIPSTGRPFTSGLERMRISTELEDEAVLPVDFLLSYAPSIRKQTSSGSRIQTLKTDLLQCELQSTACASKQASHYNPHEPCSHQPQAPRTTCQDSFSTAQTRQTQQLSQHSYSSPPLSESQFLKPTS